ncbi:MAG: S8 family serine peptidase [Clostridiales bacterium]|nr:S8 family serine peptidase [Clostridiales bacterium]
MKLWKKALSVTMAASMCVTGLPSWGEDTQTVSAASKKESDSKFATNVTKDINKKKEKNYKEGEAIVLYRNTKANIKAYSNKNVFGKDITIESSCDFSSNVAKSGAVSTKSVNKAKNKFTVSLVKSDKLSTKELLAKLNKDKNVLKAEPNYVMQATGTGDYSKYLWALDNQGQNGGTKGEDLKKNSLKDKEISKEEKVIAIADTGVNYKHEDLKNIMWNNPYTDQIKGQHGYDFVNNDDDPMDDAGHGSHCAGIIAGDAENGTGISGVAAGSNTKIMALKWLDEDGYGATYDVINAYNYVYQMQQLGVNVVAINNSWGGYVDGIYGEDAILQDVMELVGENGALSICAAGNESADIDEAITIPASFDSDYIVSVAASQEDGELADFSCYGDENVDLAAPGCDILSSVASDVFNPTIYDEKEKEDVCSYFTDFESGFVENQPGEVGTIVTGEAFGYSVLNDGSGEVSIKADKENFFGTKNADSSSMQWNIKNAKVGDTYYMCIPYHLEKSGTPIYHSYMLQEDAPDTEDTDFETSTMDIYDFSVTSGAAFDVEEEVEKADESWVGFVGGVYVYGKENYWSHLTYSSADKMKKAGDRMHVFKLNIMKDGDYSLNFDDYGISKENVESKEFGQYDFYNGTSMATPYVTGAVALLKSLYPKESAMETRMRLIGSTTAKEALKDKVATEGVLDLSKVSNPNPVISGGSIDAKGVVTVEGAFFGENPSLSVNGIQMTPLSSDNGKVTFQAETNTTLNVEVSKGDIKTSKKFFFLDGKEIKKKGVAENCFSDSSELISDGDKLYHISETGMITAYDVNNDSAYMDAETAGYKDGNLPVLYSTMLEGMYDVTKLFKDEVKNITSNDYSMTSPDYYTLANSVAHSKELYSALRLDLGYQQKDILVRYDVTESDWVKVTDIPKEFRNAQGVTMASYAGKIYLMGGYNLETQKTLSTVYSYDTVKNTWTKVADMPEGRFLSKAVQTNEKLVITLGSNGKEGKSENYIFNGTNWTIGAKLEGVLDTLQATIQIPYKEGIETEEDVTVIPLFNIAYRTIPYYDAAVGVTDEGVIYSGIRAEKMGNTFIYNVSKNVYISTGKMLTTNNKADVVQGATVGKKFFVLSGRQNVYDDYDDFDDFTLAKGKNLVKNVQQESTDYGFEDMEDLLYVSEENVKHNTIHVIQAKDYEQGYIYGVGRYDIGDTIKLTVIPNDGFYVKNLYVNGKKVKNGYTVKATEKLDCMKVTATFGKYVTMIDLPATVNVVEGSSKTLKAMPLPMNANNKNLTWSSSDTSVVTVDQKGKITAKKGVAGETATIKVTAKDRGKVYAYCTVRVESKVPVSKVQITANKKTLKVGKTLKLTAKITPSDASNKKVTWKSSKNKYATVNSKGVVKAKKAGKGKTVTITATSVSNPKIKGTIKIKIKK